MIVVPDELRKFPLIDVPFYGSSMTDLMQDMIVIKRGNCPNWTDESPSDLGIQLLWLFSVLSKLLVDRMEILAANSYIGTATLRENMRLLCNMIGYTLSEAKASSVTITFTMESGHPEITIPKGTQIATAKTSEHERIIFETSQDTLITIDDNEKDILCIQGYTINDELLGSSDGTTDQRFKLENRSVIWKSEIVEIDEGGGFNEWTRVDSLTESDGIDKHYRIEQDEDENYFIIFGDGINGKIPTRQTNGIKITYRVGGGSIGNIAAGEINEIITTGLYIESVINDNSAVGGEEKESLDHARRFAPASIRTLDRIVTVEDMENICNSYVSQSFGAVAKSKAISVAGGNYIRVMIVPAPGGYPPQGFKDELNTYLDGLRMVCTFIEVVDPIYVPIDITATVYARSNYTSDQVASAVRTSLIRLLSANYQDSSGIYPREFGEDVRLSKIYEAICSSIGVSYCQITVPIGDITIDPHEISDVGDISLTINLGNTSTSYYFAEEDNKALRSQSFAS